MAQQPPATYPVLTITPDTGGSGGGESYETYPNLAGFPATGETGVLYVAADTGKLYRWTGSAYVVVSDVPAHAASHGDGGTDEITVAQSQVTGLTTDLDGKVPTTRTVNGHPLTADVTVTKSDLGLGNVDNTSDADKPISTATQAALDAKAAAADVLPWRFDPIMGAAFGCNKNGVWSTQASGNRLILEGPNLDGAWIEWDILTAAGTWRLDVSHFTAANAAIAVASIDGTTVATKDHYSAATVYDREWSATGLTLAAGRHTLRITASGKNASSSGYLLYFTGVAMRRTGA